MLIKIDFSLPLYRFLHFPQKLFAQLCDYMHFIQHVKSVVDRIFYYL